MTKEASAMELRRKFGELLDEVYYKGDRLIVKRANEPTVAIVPIFAYEQFEKQAGSGFCPIGKCMG